MPLARASIGFSRAPRTRSPISVRVSSSQLPSMTATVTPMMMLRHHENSTPPSVNAPETGSSIDL